MNRPWSSPRFRALVPWLMTALVWGVLAPPGSSLEEKLALQTRARRERREADRMAAQVSGLSSRIDRALATACRPAPDAASLRQRAIGATRGLALSAFSLSVQGGGAPGGGASVEASGSRASVMRLVERLGDLSLGSFLRTVTLRETDSGLSASIGTGMFEAPPARAGGRRDLRACGTEPEVATDDPNPAPSPLAAVSPRRPRPEPPRVIPTPEPAMSPAPMAPFTLVGFVGSGSRLRVSIKLADEIRIVGPGDMVEGWRCVSIDPSEGAVFESASERVVLRASR